MDEYEVDENGQLIMPFIDNSDDYMEITDVDHETKTITIKITRR